MEFEAIVSGEKYRFSSLNPKSFLITGPRAEYILYKQTTNWRCADEIERVLLDRLAAVLDERVPLAK